MKPCGTSDPIRFGYGSAALRYPATSLTQKMGKCAGPFLSLTGGRLATMLMNGESNAWMLEGF